MIKIIRPIFGLYIVGFCVILLAIISIIHAWQRPVTAVSRIAFYSDRVDTLTGRVFSPPHHKYKLSNLIQDDIIQIYDGRPWRDAQRLNLLEYSGHRVGDIIPITIIRQNKIIQSTLHVLDPSPWEQLVLLRLGLSALVCAIPPTYILRRFHRYLRSDTTISLPRSVVDSSVPLWILAWYATSMVLSLNSLKNPIAGVLSDGVARLSPMLLAITAQPYPLAERWRQQNRFSHSLLLAGIAGFIIVLLESYLNRIPNNMSWPWSVGILSYELDIGYQITRLSSILAVLIIIGSSFITTFSSKLIKYLQKYPRSLTGYSLLVQLGNWIRRTYPSCPTSMAMIALFQFTILIMYVFLDVLAQFSPGGGGYSTILAAIPVSYMLLYSDSEAQVQGRRILRIILWGVGIIHVSSLLLQWIDPQNILVSWRDVTTIVFICIGTIGGVSWILIREKFRQLPNYTNLLIDKAFTLSSREIFWDYLINTISKALQIDSWLWIKEDNKCWNAIYLSHRHQEDWLADVRLQIVLQDTTRHDPRGISIGTIELPRTIIILPIIQNETQREFILASNPIGTTLHLLHESIIFQRIIQAAQTIVLMEARKHFAIQQQQVAQKLSLMVNASIQNQYQQTQEDRLQNMYLYNRLHDTIIQDIRELESFLQEIRQRFGDYRIDIAIQKSKLIQSQLTNVIKDLFKRGERINIIYMLDEYILECDSKYKYIKWRFEHGNEPKFNEFQQLTIFLIAKQAIDNAIRHAYCQEIIVIINNGDKFILQVLDNGCGFNLEEVEKNSKSLGILLMKGLAEHIGGCLSISTNLGKGCSISLLL